MTYDFKISPRKGPSGVLLAREAKVFENIPHANYPDMQPKKEVLKIAGEITYPSPST